MAAAPRLTQEELKAQYDELVKERNTLFEDRKMIGLEPTYYVGNLDPSTQEDEITLWFEKYGPVKSVRILRDSAGTSKRTAFVVFYYISSGSQACEELHGKFCDKSSTSPLIVRPERKFDIRLKEIRDGNLSGGSSGGYGNSGNMGGAPHHDSTGNAWGKVSSGRPNVKKDGVGNNYLTIPMGNELAMQHLQQPNQFALAALNQHQAPAAAAAALAANPQYALFLQSQFLANPQLAGGFPGAPPAGAMLMPASAHGAAAGNPGLAGPSSHGGYESQRQPDVPGAQIYVNNIADYVTESQVQDLFKPFGRLVKVYVRPEQSYALISYDDPAAATRAIGGANGITVLAKPGTQLEVSLKSARRPRRQN